VRSIFSDDCPNWASTRIPPLLVNWSAPLRLDFLAQRGGPNFLNQMESLF